jgi:hypothetical protein
VGGHQSSVQQTGDLEGSARGDIDVLIFVVAHRRLDRYEELLWQFASWSNVRSSSTVVKGTSGAP